MKSSSIASMFFGCLAAGTAFAACSGETVTFPGSTGGGGAGGATSSSSTSGTAGGGIGGTGGASSASTTSSSSGFGGGDACAQACAHADSCGFPVCNFIPLDCADPRASCGARCLLDATCEQIETLPTMRRDPALVGCLSGCQEGGAGGGGTGGAPPSGRDCGICSLQNRCLPSCGDDVACQDWERCVQQCLQDDPQPSCFRTCDADFPDAAGTLGDAYACTCMRCGDACGAVVDPCNARHAGP